MLRTTACTVGGATACRALDGPYSSCPAFPSAVAVDDKAVYWAHQIGAAGNAFNSGEIRRLVK